MRSSRKQRMTRLGVASGVACCIVAPLTFGFAVSATAADSALAASTQMQVLLDEVRDDSVYASVCLSNDVLLPAEVTVSWRVEESGRVVQSGVVDSAADEIVLAAPSCPASFRSFIVRGLTPGTSYVLHAEGVFVAKEDLVNEESGDEWADDAVRGTTTLSAVTGVETVDGGGLDPLTDEDSPGASPGTGSPGPTPGANKPDETPGKPGAGDDSPGSSSPGTGGNAPDGTRPGGNTMNAFPGATPAQVAALPVKQFQALPASQFRLLSSSQAAAVTPRQAAVMRPVQVKNVKPTVLAKMSVETLQALPQRTADAVTAKQWRLLSSAQRAALQRTA